MTPEQERLLLLAKARRRRKDKELQAAEASTPSAIKTAAEVGSGLASGAAGGVLDLASLPTRAATGLAGIGAMAVEKATDSPTAKKIKEYSFGVAGQPSFTSRIQGAIDKGTSGLTQPKTSTGRAIQTGAQAVGGLAAGGAVGKALSGAPSIIGKAAEFLKVRAPAKEAVTAFGAGAGGSTAAEYSEGQWWAPIAGGLAGGLLGSGIAGGVGAASSSLRNRYMTKPTGVGSELVAKTVDSATPEAQFGEVGKKVRTTYKAAKRLEDMKYAKAREISAGSTFGRQQASQFKSRIKAMLDASENENEIKTYSEAIKAMDKAAKRGDFTVGTFYDNLRKKMSKKSFASSDGESRAAAGAVVEQLDNFMNESLESGMVSNINKQAIKTWQDALSTARNNRKTFADSETVARIVDKSASDGAPINPSQISSIYKNEPGISNKIEATLNAVSKKNRLPTLNLIRRGVVSDAIKDATVPGKFGMTVDDAKLGANLTAIVKNDEIMKYMTERQASALRRAASEYSRGKFTVKTLRNTISAMIFGATQRQFQGGSTALTEQFVGPLQSNIDEIIKVLDAPVELPKQTPGSFQRPVATGISAANANDEERRVKIRVAPQGF